MIGKIPCRLSAWVKHAAYATTLVVPLLFFGCASLPDYDSLRPAKPHTKIRVVAPDGSVSRRGAAELVRNLEQGQSEILRHHLALMESLDGPPLVAGNDAHLLVDGPATYKAEFAAMEAAKDHINLEVYIFRDDTLGDRLAELLIRKQAQGVQVNVMYDAIGSILTSQEFFARMTQAGINVVAFNPVTPVGLLKLNNRDHRKIIVVDGVVAFAGGINISNVYSSGSSGLSASRRRAEKEKAQPNLEDGWRDTQIQILGPAVGEFQRLFMEQWKSQDGPPLTGRNYFPEYKRQGNKLVRIIGSSPGSELNLIYIELLSAIQHAEKSIHITVAYFVPDKQVIEALQSAARRGVDVTLVLPGFSDFWLVFAAGRSYYSDLLEAGVKIYEQQDAMLHAKTAVIDGVWSTVGSANMDMRSFLSNYEVNAVILGEEFGNEMEAMFRSDLRRSAAITLDKWKQRPPAQRMKEWVARMWQYWL